MGHLRFELESMEALGGKRGLIIIPPNDHDDELCFNIDTYQNISLSPEKENAKKEAELDKLYQSLEQAEQLKDQQAIERITNQIVYSSGSSIADQVIKYNNMFLSRLSPEKADRLYRYYATMWDILSTLSFSNRREVMNDLTRETIDLFKDVDLPTYCIAFTVDLKIPLPDPTQVGYKQHHTASKTFSAGREQNGEPDYLEMTAMSFLAKLLFPIWGQYCYVMKKAGIGAIDKEFYCLQFLAPALARSRFSRIYEKYKAYIFSDVTRILEKASRNPYGNESHYDRNMFTLSKRMFSETQFQMLNLAKIIVKRLVVFNTEVSSLKGEDFIPNVMIFSQAINEKNVTNTIKQINHNSALLTRDEPRGSGDDNFTYMENGSRITKMPPDSPIYTRLGCEIHIPREVVRRGFDLELFNTIVEYYHGKRLLRRNVFTDAILSIFLFPIIGSSENIKHLQAKQYIMAVALVQLVLLKEVNDPYGESLALMLSAGQSDEPKENKVGPVTTAILATAEKTPEYRELMDRYPHSCEILTLNESIIGSKPKGVTKDKVKGTINIAKHVALIKDWLLDYDHYVNICPELWKFIPNLSGKSRPKQNDILQYSADFMNDYYKFILDNCPDTKHVITEGDKFFSELGYK